jgi:eukaryotic-like serine/threonine-protein kinase
LPVKGIDVDKLNSDLLVVVLAILTDAVPRSAATEAIKSWTENSGHSLIEWLKRSSGLDDERIRALQCLASSHLEAHQNDFRLSLDAWNAFDLTQDVLTEVNDEALRTTLGASLHGDETLPFDGAKEGHSSGSSANQHSSNVGGARFQLIRQHARGGIGQVWLARDGELQRDVAVKEIQPQYAGSENQRARFVLEAEITGNLEHPGIVPVYSLGRNAEGRPYYAMRFIEGESFSVAIKRFYQARGEKDRDAGPRQRPSWGIEFRKLLRRFLDVCDAIDFAHSRNVLHRDLKPANIMLGRFGETLVVDWGLAKVLGKAEVIPAHEAGEFEPVAAGASHTIAGETEPGTTIGTPSYMSPEQARGAIDQLGPASDVYSLGVTLYELITGKVPFPGKKISELIEKVVKGEFPPPRSLDRTIPAPLEAVCLKAMALEPAGRYHSVRELAQDLEHWLADEPVAAYPERRTERFGRWLRQHRTLTYAGVTGLVVVSLVATAAAMLIEGGRQREIAARTEAETNFDMAQKAVDDYLTKVSENRLLNEQDSVDIRQLRRDLLENALHYYKSFVAERSNDPALRQQLANAHFRVGAITGDIGSAHDAITEYREAQRIWQAEVLVKPNDHQLKVRLADCSLAIGRRQAALGDLQEAMKSFMAARAILEELTGRNSPLVTEQSRLADCYAEIGILQGKLESGDLGLDMLGKATAIQQQMIGHGRGDFARRVRLAEMINALGFVYFKRNDFPAAIRCFHQVQELCVSLTGEITEGPVPVKLLSLLALSHYNVATMLVIDKQLDKAFESFEKSLEYRRALVDTHRSVSSFRENLGNSYREVAIQEQRAGHNERALSTLQKAIDIFETLVRSEPEQARYHAALGRTWNAVGFIHDKLRENRKAVPAFEKAVKEQENAVAKSPADNENKAFLCELLENLGEQYLDLGAVSDAWDPYNRALEIRRKLNVGHPENRGYAKDLADALSRIGTVQRHVGDSTAALKSFGEAREVVEEFLTRERDDPAMRGRLGAAFVRDAWIQSDLHQTGDALKSLQRAIDELKPLSKLPSGESEGREWLTEALQERARILRTLNQNAEADKVAAERVDLWMGQSANQLAALALAQASRAALIGYGKVLAPEKTSPVRNLDLAAENLKLAIAQGFVDLSMLKSERDAAILLERDDIKALINGLESRKPALPSQPAK